MTKEEMEKLVSEATKAVQKLQKILVSLQSTVETELDVISASLSNVVGQLVNEIKRKDEELDKLLNESKKDSDGDTQ
ncbi:MAG: hypothetical protein QXL94_01095 [Candidatus Parvarchaeum sp.]